MARADAEINAAAAKGNDILRQRLEASKKFEEQSTKIRLQCASKIRALVEENIEKEKKIKQNEHKKLEESLKMTSKLQSDAEKSGFANPEEFVGQGIEMVKIGLDECCNAIQKYQVYINQVKCRTELAENQIKKLSRL